jgi:hypothetical protein
MHTGSLGSEPVCEAGVVHRDGRASRARLVMPGSRVSRARGRMTTVWSPSMTRGKKTDRTLHVAFIGAGAAIVAAIIGLFGGNSGAFVGILPGSPVETITMTAPTVTQTVTATSTSSPQPTPAGVRWGPGRLRLDSVDLDTIPPTVQAGAFGDLHSLAVNGDYGLKHGFGRIAAWSGEGQLNASACLDTVTTQAQTQTLRVSVGTVVCVITNDEHVAAVTVTELPPNPNDGYMWVDAIAWDAP